MMASGCSCLAIQIFSGTVLGFLGEMNKHALMIRFDFLETSFDLFGKMCITASFNVAYIFSGEVFATSIRNSSMGIVSGMGRVGAILSPYIVMAGESFPGFHFLVFGLLGISGGLLSFWLPETKDKPLPETVAEMTIDKTKKMNTQQV